jgi:glutaminase
VCADLSAHLGLHVFNNRTTFGTGIGREYDLRAVRSTRVRPPAERAVLERRGHEVAVVELQGVLHFGGLEGLTRRVAARPPQLRCLVLDMKRVSGADLAAARLLDGLAGTLERAGTALRITHLPTGAPTRRFLEEHGVRDRPGRRLYFDDTDTALGELEDELVAPERHHRRGEELALAELAIVEGLLPDDVDILRGMMTRCRFEAGESVFREGDPGDAIYLLAGGRVSVRLALDGSERRARIATLAAGVTFGEMAILGGGASVRSADVWADEPIVCWRLPVSAWEALGHDHPRIALVLFRNLARDLSDRLRVARDVIRSLAQ